MTVKGFISNKIVVIALLFVVVIGISATFIFIQNKQNQNKQGTLSSQTQNSKLQVTTSFYPLYFFAKQIGGNAINVTNLTPAGSEPHDYEPTASQIDTIYKSQLFIYNGNGLEPWADKIQSELKTKNLQYIQMSDKLTPIDRDPHFWVSPSQGIKQAAFIRDKLVEIDSINRNLYEENADKLFSQLLELESNFKSTLSNCKQKELVSSHNFMQYVARDYGFKSTPVSGISPEDEPSSQDLTSLTELVKSKGIKYIVTETLVSPKLAETLANEVGAKTVVINPLEGLTEEEINAGQDYISVQKTNLSNLTKALDCSQN
jgi:zinc transport system substrate-binding protein